VKISDDIALIGDPHFGIDFDKRGTPLHRRGERAAMQLAQFQEELKLGQKLNIMVGDLFDKPFVELKLTHQIADAYEQAAKQNPDKLWVLMAGNHDIPRQVRDPKTGELVKGSFHALARMLQHLDNVIVLFEPAVVAGVACFPWQWTVTAEQQVENLNDALPSIAVGHWDLIDFGGSTDHIAPVASLEARGVSQFFSGHIHLAGEYSVGSSTIHCTGSMQPYTHGEDPTETFYRTLTLDELEGIDVAELRDVNLRVILKPGEVLPDLDCLSIVPKREGGAEATEFTELSMEGFDVKTVLAQKMEERNVPDPTRDYVWEKIGVID